MPGSLQYLRQAEPEPANLTRQKSDRIIKLRSGQNLIEYYLFCSVKINPDIITFPNY